MFETTDGIEILCRYGFENALDSHSIAVHALHGGPTLYLYLEPGDLRNLAAKIDARLRRTEELKATLCFLWKHGFELEDAIAPDFSELIGCFDPLPAEIVKEKGLREGATYEEAYWYIWPPEEEDEDEAELEGATAGA